MTMLTAAVIMLAALFSIGCEGDTIPVGDGTGQLSQLAGKLLILQAYGNVTIGSDGLPDPSDNSPAGASHSFIELYNTTDNEINLNGISLYYANGIRGTDVTEDWEWEKIALTGKIPAGGSFLILGNEHEKLNSTRYKMEDGYGDMNEEFFLSRRSFKVALIEGSAKLGMQNPFDVKGSGKTAAGYIDMVGAANDPTHSNPDNIFGYETAPARCSASEAIRRKSLTDTNNNSADFIAARYALGGMTDEILEVCYPRNAKDNPNGWNPFTTPEIPEMPPFATALMILQANTFGNNNGFDQTPPSPTGGGFARSVIELYNNSEDAINLTAGNYYLHIGSRSRLSSADPWEIKWTNVIKLTGSIPAKSSFLIVSNTSPEEAGVNINTTPRATLPAADQSADFVLSNDGFKIAVLIGQSTLLGDTVNPFTEESLRNDYVDMLGAGNTNVAGFETAFIAASRPQGPRRTSLVDTNNNSTDFAQADLRGRTGTRGVDDDQLFKIWPRNSSAGTWDPITGLPAVHPTVVQNIFP